MAGNYYNVKGSHSQNSISVYFVVLKMNWVENFDHLEAGGGGGGGGVKAIIMTDMDEID